VKNYTLVEYSSNSTTQALEMKAEDSYMKDKKYMLRNCTKLKFEKDKIIEETTYFDQVAFLRQVGFFEQKR
jgi:uncharacterized membrane-anchored protein YitT (DUF2179 family)